MPKGIDDLKQVCAARYGNSESTCRKAVVVEKRRRHFVMALVTAFFTYLVKFIIMLAVVAGGFIFGKKLRDNKNKQSAN